MQPNPVLCKEVVSMTQDLLFNTELFDIVV